MAHQKIIILDFGGQYTQLIARRVRENHVFSEVVPWSISAEEIKKRAPMGVILSGGPSSVCDPDAPHISPAIYDLGVPVLGICYGMQLTAHLLGGKVQRAQEREYGRVTVRMKRAGGLAFWHERRFLLLDEHTWQVVQCPPASMPSPKRTIAPWPLWSTRKTDLRRAIPSRSDPHRRG
jgi:GMP synthase (glutamine-hydrolysing)